MLFFLTRRDSTASESYLIIAAKNSKVLRFCYSNDSLKYVFVAVLQQLPVSAVSRLCTS